MAKTLSLRPYGDDRDRDVVQFFDLEEGVRLGIRSRWSAYDTIGRLFLLDADETQFAGPIAVVPALDLLRQYKHDPRVPSGELFVYGANRQAPTFETIGVDQNLIYRTAAEVA